LPRTWKYQPIISPRPRIRPGMIPPMKSRMIETFAMTPKTTMGMEGGMIGPLVVAAAKRAAAFSGS
jgi:hypothetical protein